MREIKHGNYTIQEVWSNYYNVYVFYVYDNWNVAVSGRDAENIVSEALMDEYGGGVYFISDGDAVLVKSVNDA